MSFRPTRFVVCLTKAPTSSWKFFNLAVVNRCYLSTTITQAGHRRVSPSKTWHTQNFRPLIEAHRFRRLTAARPLQIKVNVRDHFDAPGCAVRKAFDTLEELVGLKAICNVEWDLLWNTLEAGFPEKASFVPNVAAIVEAWCDALSAQLNDDQFTKWTEELVGRLESTGAIKLHLQVSDDEQPTTSWDRNRSSFLLFLPRSLAPSPSRASSGFQPDFQALFDDETTTKSTQSSQNKSHDDEWAEIDEMGEAASIKPERSFTKTEADSMPSVTTLPTPDILFKTLTPYILHVTQKSSRMIDQDYGKLVVQCTHEPTLQFLSQYLQRWIRKDHRDFGKVPLLRITLHESNIGLGQSHDALTIEPYDMPQEKRGVAMNVTYILAFIESVLGYHRLPGVSAGFWEFRRDIPFK